MENRTNSEIIKENNPHFYYTLLEFKDRYSDRILEELKIPTCSLSDLNKDQIKQVVDLMCKVSLKEII